MNALRHDLKAPWPGHLSKSANPMLAAGDATIEVLGEAGNHPLWALMRF